MAVWNQWTIRWVNLQVFPMISNQEYRATFAFPTLSMTNGLKLSLLSSMIPR